MQERLSDLGIAPRPNAMIPISSNFLSQIIPLPWSTRGDQIRRQAFTQSLVRERFELTEKECYFATTRCW